MARGQLLTGRLQIVFSCDKIATPGCDKSSGVNPHFCVAVDGLRVSRQLHGRGEDRRSLPGSILPFNYEDTCNLAVTLLALAAGGIRWQRAYPLLTRTATALTSQVVTI